MSRTGRHHDLVIVDDLYTPTSRQQRVYMEWWESHVKERTMKKAIIAFHFTKSTKGAHRYDEVEAIAEGHDPSDTSNYAVGGLYIRKNFFGPTAPRVLRVTIEDGDVPAMYDEESGELP